MDDPNEICRICHEPRHAHVATAKGQFTHPREARGEGTYKLVASGSMGFGLNCSECGGACAMDHFYETWEFVPAPKEATA